MPDILAITGPIFLLIALGFAAVRSGFFARDALPALAGFVITFALPALLFKSLAQRSVAEVMNPHYLAAYAAGSLLTLGAGLAYAHWVREQDRAAAAMTGLGMACANTAFVGYPVALQVVGRDGALAALLVVGPVAAPLQIAAVLLACAPMLNIYPILGQKYGQRGVAAAGLLVCTVAAFASIGAVIWGLHASAVFGPLG